jgi:hypothetical protein
MENRPLPIVILAGYYLLIGLIGLLGSLFATLVGVFAICFAPGMLPGGIWGIVMSVLALMLAGAIWSGKNWAVMAVTVLAIIGIVSGVLSFITGNGLPLINMLINAGVVLYMQSDSAKQYFNSR